MRALLLASCGLLLLLGSANAQAIDFGTDTRVRAFIDEVSTRHGFDRAELQTLLSRATHRPEIIQAISSPAEQLPWYRYRPIFLTDERISQGVAFWNAHAELLERISLEYGVPAQILVAIVGVETFYGRFTGRHQVLDALATLAFDYPPRADFFRRELEQFLLLAREEGFDPLQPTGSYAGAMGVPQFISSSYRTYAVDGSGNGRRDLFNDPADILASVANYFRRHGWRQNEPVARRASVRGNAWRPLLLRELKPQHTVSDLLDAHVRFDTKGLAPDAHARLLELELSDGNEYWATLHNFYVITRYNHSPLYAMAVFQLAQAVKDRRQAS